MVAVGDSGALLGPGNHGTTFGGNPVACAAGLAVIHTIESQNLLDQVRSNGHWLREQLAAVPGISAVRGAGMLTAFELAQANAPKLVAAALEAGFIINATDDSTIRLAPPLVITQEQLGSFLAVLPPLIASA
jgi:acetylornithine aminotransferase